jgi:hypothetical protein
VDLLTDGFQLKSPNSSNISGGTYIYMAIADTSAVGDATNDKSGQGNHWLANNLATSDQMIDSPTNNFCTLNPIYRNQTVYQSSGPGQFTYTEGNLSISEVPGSGGAGYAHTKSTFSMKSGKWYMEWCLVSMSSNAGVEWGLLTESYTGSTYGNLNPETGTVTMRGPQGIFQVNGVNAITGLTHSAGDIGSVAYDPDTQTVWYALNGVWRGAGTQNPATNAGGWNFNPSEDVFFGAGDGGSQSWQSVANFGQDATFAGYKSPSTVYDDGDYGSFYYQPPTGFKALCTKNFPDPTIKPGEHFNAVTYAGDGSGSNAITGAGFQPDLVWIKGRNGTYRHELHDVIRGAGTRLFSDGYEAETSVGTLDSFDSDGMTVSMGTGGQNGTNSGSGNYISWLWKAGGAAVSNTAGSITSQVSVNTASGFSIISYTGNATAGATVGHGLSKAPEMFIRKANASAGKSYNIFHHKANANPETGALTLDETDLFHVHLTYWNNTAPTASVFSLGTAGAGNTSGASHIVWAFHSVDGFSKFGSYTAAGGATNISEFVYLGFRPKFVMIKNTGQGNAYASWAMYDGSRQPINPTDHNSVLWANSNMAEGSRGNGGSSGTFLELDFLANGFKTNETDNYEISDPGQNHIYMAFAEFPFKYANAR